MPDLGERISVTHMARHGFLFLALTASSSCASAFAHSATVSCIGSGDESTINAHLQQAGDRALLCPRSVFTIASPIKLAFDDQELATQGSPVGDARARIRVVGATLASAIESRASNIHIHHLIMDGGRTALDHVSGGGALIEIGGDVTGIRVDHVRAFDPRGWSVLHVFEGSRQCSGASITDNVLGPAGKPDRTWADGISFACRNGHVARNQVIDASDGGIVIFGSPGTVVENNTIKTEKNVLLGGINLVDYHPFDGDYAGVIVRHNRIEARSGFIKVAIALGPAAWGIGKGDWVNHGGAIVDNTIAGPYFGYGIAVDGVEDFTISGNRVIDALRGGDDHACDAGHVPSGHSFIMEGTPTGHYQSGFMHGPARWSICVKPNE